MNIKVRSPVLLLCVSALVFDSACFAASTMPDCFGSRVLENVHSGLLGYSACLVCEFCLALDQPLTCLLSLDSARLCVSLCGLISVKLTLPGGLYQLYFY